MEIEKDVPFPGKKGRGKYPFWKMNVGDSFRVEIKKAPAVRAAASIFGVRNGTKFSVLKDGEEYRIWRTE